MKITVTRKHIWRGTPKSKTSCPIALAIQEAIPTDYGAVERTHVRFMHQTRGLPARAMGFIARFDGWPLVRRLLPPFSFDLDYTQHVISPSSHTQEKP